MKKGFTLIELLVVVLIIGILSSIALPRYQKAVLQAKAATVFPKITALETAEKEFKMANGYYTSDLSALSIDAGAWGCTGGNDDTWCQLRVSKDLIWEFVFYSTQNKFNIFCIARTENGGKVCEKYGTLQAHLGGEGVYDKYYLVRTVQ